MAWVRRHTCELDGGKMLDDLVDVFAHLCVPRNVVNSSPGRLHPEEFEPRLQARATEPSSLAALSQISHGRVCH
jgi:hypothetical protein